MYVGYCRLRKIWEMSAKADTNCHDILTFVSATRTHCAKIGATRCVVADMSATFPAKMIASSGFFGVGAYGSQPDAAIWWCLRTGGGGVLTR
jgi:hypothetical protein